MSAFDYRQAEDIRDVFARHQVRCLFIDKSGAVLLGFPDTTQDADVFMERSPDNGKTAVMALRELGFIITQDQAEQIERGKDFVQMKNGPFDLDLIFAPDDIIASKAATNRQKDRETLPRLKAFRDYWVAQERKRHPL